MVKQFASVPVAALMMAVVGGLGIGDAGATDQPVVLSQGAESYGPVTPYLTQPLGSLPQRRAWQPGDPIREIPRRVYPGPDIKTKASGVGATDELVATLDAARAPTLLLNVNIAGIGFTGAVPPDTVGDVGPNHFVQAVNASQVAVYDKDGALLAGPFALDSLAPGGDQCSNGGGDPIVLYDQLADRWFLQEFISGGNRLCLYISQTSDPTGAYHFYGFATPSFPDYPHYGVWSDAYIAGTNEGGGNETTYAFDRTNMLAGLPATMQRLTAVPPMAAYGFQVLTPADHDGATPPPAGEPGIFMRHFDDEAHSGSPNPGTDSLQIFEMDIDWDTPANTTVTQLPSVSISDYNSWFINYTTFFSIPQPSSSTRLDPIREAILNRLIYRNFGTHESLVGNFATNRNPATSGSAISAGIRWFELRRSGGGNWTLHEEGTFGGDSNSPTAQYFMGGIAMDGAGNIGLGYSKTDTDAGTATFPSIGITGRLADDPAGTMAPETIVATGTDPSNQGGGRWGDYAAMGIDPADDCTFWYTNEYMPGSSWGTQITSFTFQECLFGFTMAVDPTEVNACALTDPDPVYSISIAENGGWDDLVNLSASGLPPGTSAQFSVNGQQPPFTSELTIDGVELSESGSYAIAITGTGTDVPPMVRVTEVALNLAMLEPETPALVSPGDGATAMSQRPTLSWSAAADAAEYLVEVATDSGFGTIVYSAVETGTSHQVATSLAPSTQHWWRVSAANHCGDMTSASRSFTTVAVVCATYPSTDVPVAIPAVAATVESELVIADSGTISDVNVLDLAGTHSWITDLVFTLHSPDGSSAVLMANVCGDLDDFDINFDDEAAPGAPPCPPTDGGTYQPAEALAGFQGEEGSGTWVLEVEDVADQDGGSLASWGLEVCLEASVDLTPVFTSTPVTSAQRAEAYSYAITVDAPEGTAAVVITADTLPTWLTLEDDGNGAATLSGVPGFAELGPHSVVLRADNGQFTVTQPFTVTVEDVNEAPTFTSAPVTSATRGQAYSYSVTATDPNPGATLSFGADTPLPGWLTLTDHENGTATLSGTPDFGDVGDNAVSLLVSDGELDDSQSFTIAVADVNVPPEFVSAPVTTASTRSPYVYEVVTSDQNLGSILAISSIGPLPSWLSLSDHGDGTATLSGTPQPQDAGEAYVVLQVSDGTASAEQPIAIDVALVNEAPAFTSTPVEQAVAAQPYAYLVTATDGDGDVLTISADTVLPGWLTLQDNGDGSALLSGTPSTGDVGSVNVTVLVSDGIAEAGQSFTIDVAEPANVAPVFTSAPVVRAVRSQAYAYLVTVTDADGDALTIGVDGTLPGWLSFEDHGDGTATLSGTPTAGDTDPVDVTLVASDAVDETQQSFTIEILDAGIFSDGFEAGEEQ